MNIALVCYEYPGVTSNCGGGGAVVKELAIGLRGRGYDVDVVTDKADGHYLTSPPRLYEGLQSVEPDLIHAHFSVPSGIAAARYAEETSTPLLTTCMGADIYDPTRFRLLARLRDRGNRYVFNRSESVTVPSTDMADRVRDGFDVDPTVIHHGIDPSTFEWRPHRLSTPVRILTVARVVARKNLEQAIESVQWLRDRGINAHYRIVGEGSRRQYLQQQFADRDWLRFDGYVPDLSRVYQQSDLFFLPSHHEAFGMVFLEALSAGLPVVASDSGGQTDIIRDPVGTLADPDRTGALADALKDVINNYSHYQRLTENYVSEQFSASRMLDQYTERYDALSHEQETTQPLRAD